MKTCTKCRVEKAKSEFHKRSKAKDGLQSWCSECSIAGRIDYYKRNSDKEKEYDSGRTAKIRKTIQDYKGERGCSSCGDARFYILDFHHLEDKDDEVSNMITRGLSLKRIMKEIGKCIILCRNCHGQIHYLENNARVV